MVVFAVLLIPLYIFVGVRGIIVIIRGVSHSPLWKIGFARNAVKNNRVAEATRSCRIRSVYKDNFTVERHEYMYVVNGKNYYVTYRLLIDHEKQKSLTEVSDDCERLADLRGKMSLLYGKNPKKCMLRVQTLLPVTVLQKVSTKRNNPNRDFDRNWSKYPITIYEE